MLRFSNLSFFRPFQIAISKIASTAARVDAYLRRTSGRTLFAKGGYFLFLGGVSFVLLGNSDCDDNATTGELYASRIIGGITRAGNSGYRVGAISSDLSRQITGTDGSQTGTANFAGNFTQIAEAAGGTFVLVRMKDCSLDLVTANPPSDPGTTTTHYELTLHQLASLKTTADAYAKGCPVTSTGISSRPGVFVGATTNGNVVFAAAGPNGGNNAVFLYDNSTSGTTATTDTSLPAATAIAVGDLNKDGNNDIVVVNGYNATSSSVSVLLGNADGTFGSAVNYSVGGNFAAAAVIDDVNGDGKLDIVAVSNDQQISVLLGNGDGTFQPATSFAAPTLPGYASASKTPIVSMITADVNGDGKKDLICSNGLVLLGNGDGTFTAVATPAFPYTLGTSSEGPNLASGDLNNDGKVDLVLSTGSAVLTWLGNGDGTFTQGSSYAAINSTGFVTVSDLDGDGNADIYVGMANGGLFSGDDSIATSAYVLMGNGDGTFQGAPVAPGAYSGNNLVDINGDGIPDLISNTTGLYGNTSSPSFTVALGSGKGTFASKSTVTPPDTFSLNGYSFSGVASVGASAYAVGDVNGDDKPDLVFVSNNLTAKNPGGSTIQYPYPVYFVALGNGDGTFQTPVPYAFPQIAPSSGFDNALTVSSLEIADFNKDGRRDLVFVYNDQAGGTGVNPYLQGFAVLTGNGDGTFNSTAIETSTYNSSAAPATALTDQITNVVDLNGDGAPDLVVIVPSFSVASGATTQLQVFLSKGDGTFQSLSPVTVAANVYGTPVVADFDQDGRSDLAFLTEDSSGQAGFAIATGAGSGTFNAATIVDLTGGDSIRSAGLAAADFNGDGKPDLALFENSAFSGIFYGDGDGTFTSVPESNYVVPKDLINLAGGTPAVAVDLNGDGKPDILAGNVVLLSQAAPVVTGTTASSTTLSASANSIALGASVTFTATVAPASGSGTPTGTVTFLDGTTTLGTGTLAAGKATYTTTSLATGAHSITAAYGGDSTFAASTSTAATVTVSSVAVVGTTTSLSATPTSAVTGTSIALSSTVTPASGTAVPTGSVNFLDGTTSLGTGSLNGSGTASFSTSTLAVGTHSLTAQYGGDPNFSGSTSSAASVTISAPPPDFALSISPTSGSETAAASATATVTVTPSNGFNAAVSFACTGLPAGLSCSFSPATVTPSGAAGTTQMTIEGTLTAGMRREGRHPGMPLSLAGLGLGLLLMTRWRKHGVLLRSASVLLVALALAGLGGCGGGGGGSSNTQKTQMQTSTVTVTGTSGTLSHTATYSVTASN